MKEGVYNEKKRKPGLYQSEFVSRTKGKKYIWFSGLTEIASTNCAFVP